VCDELDVCPDAPDPGQADLDGDGSGWMCDPVESVPIATASLSIEISAAIHRDTFAAVLRSDCSSNACRYQVVAASAEASSSVLSGSSDPRDEWLASADAIVGPYVSRDQRVYLSRARDLQLDTGELELAQRTYGVQRANGSSTTPPTAAPTCSR
jgi:hypothetical protein